MDDINLYNNILSSIVTRSQNLSICARIDVATLALSIATMLGSQKQHALYIICQCWSQPADMSNVDLDETVHVAMAIHARPYNLTNSVACCVGGSKVNVYSHQTCVSFL